MSTLAIVIFVAEAIFISLFVPWYHQRDPAAVNSIRTANCRECGLSRHFSAYGPVGQGTFGAVNPAKVALPRFFCDERV